MKQKVIATVSDGYNGKTATLTAFARPDGKIYLTADGIFYWSGSVINRALSGINQITLPLRHYVKGFTVEETDKNDHWNVLLN